MMKVLWLSKDCSAAKDDFHDPNALGYYVFGPAGWCVAGPYEREDIALGMCQYLESQQLLQEAYNEKAQEQRVQDLDRAIRAVAVLLRDLESKEYCVRILGATNITVRALDVTANDIDCFECELGVMDFLNGDYPTLTALTQDARANLFPDASHIPDLPTFG